MASLRTKTDQVCDVLREGMLGGRWRGYLPGRDRLAGELGCSHWVVEEAMQRLARENLLVSEGAGRRRRIVLPEGEAVRKDLRVQVLSYDADSRRLPHHVELVDQLRLAGFAADFAQKSQAELGMDAERVAAFVKRSPADAWVVQAGSREVLEWFSGQEVPVLAQFGRFHGLPIAAVGRRIAPVLRDVVRRLVGLGHRRIAMLAQEERRHPFPAHLVKEFLDELAVCGLPTGPFNLPDWKGTPEGFAACLDSLFNRTPPTALILEETRLLAAAQLHLARKGIRAPEDVSLICMDMEPSLTWCRPLAAHFRWDTQPIIRHILRWAQRVATGKNNKRQVMFDSELVEGSTIGPAAAGASRHLAR